MPSPTEGGENVAARKLHISLPPSRHIQMATRTHFRVLVLIAELFLTTLTAFGLLLLFLQALGHDPAPLVLHVTIACTILVYAAMEGSCALVRSRWFRVRCGNSAYWGMSMEDGYSDDADSDWEPDGADDDLNKGPFAMSPAVSRRFHVEP
ncbi:hypothetical protein C8F01DRAFT_1164672 [Mycena amicta]|nr:hypothetical protein C8F01DRAFT_1164672 [Mycena amicta]